jgi:hypothetical protein
MTQEQAIQRGFTHFIEVWRNRSQKEGENVESLHKIGLFDGILDVTTTKPNLYTVAIFLIKPKLK